MDGLTSDLHPLQPAVLRWIAAALGPQARVNQVRYAPGATSSSVYFVEAEVSGQPLNCVLRLFTNTEWLRDEPDLAAHEMAALQLAHQAGLPAPQVLGHAPDRSDCGVPAVLMRHMPGDVVLRPLHFDDWLKQLAENLVRIHNTPAAGFPWKYFSWVNRESLAVPGWTKDPALWERAIEIGLAEAPGGQQGFLHRDYHPTNVLWESGRLSAVVDWVNACHGPPGVDIAHCRSNLVSMYGVQAAQRFLEFYLQAARTGFEYHPYWDIESLLDGLPEPGYYPPWLDFGLGMIEQNLLNQRKDEFLRQALRAF